MSTEYWRHMLDPTERAEREAILALSFAPHVGPSRLRTLMAYFGSAVDILEAPLSMLTRVDGIGAQVAESVVSLNVDAEVEEQLKRAERCGAELVTIQDADYPALFHEIHDPPVCLWVKGTLIPADASSIAVVGTRRPTDQGKRAARFLSSELAQQGYTIVSGLAYGIDAAAHEGALDAGGRTIAVLGSGVDRIYPTAHLRLADRISASGAVISEFALGTAPDAPNFPRRNRLISGLALGTVVVEARESGGALLTAHIALEQNREVFAVPGSIFSRESEGTNRLIRKSGAKLVQSVKDIISELPPLRSAGPSQSGSSKPLFPANLSDLEMRILSALGAESMHIDTLCNSLDLNTADALVQLLQLEFSGLVRQVPGKCFHRI